MANADSLPEDFTGVARLFPLPNLVMFPFVVQPLHIFEPRYRQMTADALAGDRLIAPVLLRPGWEADYEGRPPVHAVAAVGRVVADQRLADGRYNLLLRGLSRVRILEELPSDKLYRSARVEVLEDVLPSLPVAGRLRKELRKFLGAWSSLGGPTVEQFHKLLGSELSAGTLCDVFAFALPIDQAAKQQILEELDVAARVGLLLAQAPEQLPAPSAGNPPKKYPPDFSDN